MEPGLKKISPISTITAVLVVAVIVLGIWWLTNKDAPPTEDFTKTPYGNITGVQGIVRFVDYANQKFVTERIVLIEEDGEFRTKEDVFNFSWTEETNFFYYSTALALAADQPWIVDFSYLVNDRNVIVTPEETHEPGTQLSAKSIRILPGYAQEQAQ